jgi:hypothetical protein
MQPPACRHGQAPEHLRDLCRREVLPLGEEQDLTVTRSELHQPRADERLLARGRGRLVLTAIGLALVIVGVYIVSNVWKEPHYDVMLAWDPEAMPAGWEAGRRRYFALNWIQAAATWTVFGLFLAALILL